MLSSTSMTNSISVVIPTFNSSQFISQTLESIFKQTHLPREIIVVDDASTDVTCEIVTAISRQSPVPIHLHRLQINTGGPAVPFNIGIRSATGSLIATLDHDDRMLPEKLEMQSACLDREVSLGLVLSNFYYHRGNVRREVSPLAIIREAVGQVDQFLGDEFYRIGARDCYTFLVDKSPAGSCSNFLFPKRVWAECRGFDEQLTSCCDYGFLQDVARDHDVGIVNRTLFYYNWLDESLYRRSHRLIRKLDHLRVSRRFEAELLSRRGQRKLRRRLRNELLGLAHLLRDEGAYTDSLYSYLESLYRGGWNKAALYGIAKLLPHKCLKSLEAALEYSRRRQFI